MYLTLHLSHIISALKMRGTFELKCVYICYCREIERKKNRGLRYSTYPLEAGVAIIESYSMEKYTVKLRLTMKSVGVCILFEYKRAVCRSIKKKRKSH